MCVAKSDTPRILAEFYYMQARFPEHIYMHVQMLIYKHYQETRFHPSARSRNKMLGLPPQLLLFIMVHFLSLFHCMHSYTDRDALLCLKSQLSDPTGALASWSNSSLTFCTWHGVTCNTSRVISLDLESLNLTGQIFPCVGELSFLTRIHMPNNQLNGHIDHEIGRLTRLRYLNLSMNSPWVVRFQTTYLPVLTSRSSASKEIPLKVRSLKVLLNVCFFNKLFLATTIFKVAFLPG